MGISEEENARCGAVFPGPRNIIAPRLDLRRDLFEPDHARELAHFALLVFAKPHQERHRRPDQLLNFRAVGVDVHLAGRRVPGAAQLRAHHVAQCRFDRGPIFDLVVGQSQPALETVDLAVVEQSGLGRSGAGGGAGSRRFGFSCGSGAGATDADFGSTAEAAADFGSTAGAARLAGSSASRRSPDWARARSSYSGSAEASA